MARRLKALHTFYGPIQQFLIDSLHNQRAQAALLCKHYFVVWHFDPNQEIVQSELAY